MWADFKQFCTSSQKGAVAVHTKMSHPGNPPVSQVIPEELKDLFTRKGLDASYDFSSVIFRFRQRVVSMTSGWAQYYGKKNPPTTYEAELSRSEALEIFVRFLEPNDGWASDYNWHDRYRRRIRRKLPDWSSTKRANFNKRSRAITRN